MTEHSHKEIKEVQPQFKVLIIDAQPTNKQNLNIAQNMFGVSSKKIEDFSQLIISSINSPKKDEAPTLEDRERMSDLKLPDSVDDFAAIVITGSPFAAFPRETKEGLFVAKFKRDLIDFVKVAHDKNKPILGICFGEHILAEALGGKVVKMKSKTGEDVWEVGWGKIKRSAESQNDPVLEGLSKEFVAPEYHGDVVSRIPDGGVMLAENEYGVQGFRIGNAWGFEFHPERGQKKVEEQLQNDRNVQRIEKLGLDIEEVRSRGNLYNPGIKRIFSNFLRFASKGTQ